MAVLITGGSGFLGTMLAKDLLDRGREVVIFDIQPPGKPISAGNNKVLFHKGDITNLPEVLNAVQEHKIDTIFHLTALPSVPSEANPWASINVNALGTYHVLEAARLFKADQVLFTSSIAGYLNTADPNALVTEETAQRPNVIYGITKVFSELLGLYYHRKFGLDVRGIRVPVVIGPGVHTPGFGQYNSKMIEAAILGLPYEVYVTEETTATLLYVKDTVRSMLMLSEAPKDQIVTRVYNLGHILPAPSAGDIARTVKKYIPEARITFKADPEITAIVQGGPKRISGERAEKEWGWHVRYSLDEAVKDFIAEVRTGMVQGKE
jgi:threonine 3-dehydrogenase